MKYVALLRGINVGGNNMIKMETLRATVASLGFENVKSYINSGNLIFECGSPNVSKGLTSDKEIANAIHNAIQKDFGFDISVMARSMAEIEDIVKSNPFEGQFDDDKNVHVFFLDDKLTDAQEAFLLDQGNENEIFAIFDRHVICMLKIHLLDSAVGKGFIDKKLKVASTGRNWRTVNKLTEFYE